MIYVVLLMFLAGLTLGVGGMNSWTQSALERKEAKRIQSEQRLAEETAKAVEEGKNKLIDMQAAFEAGQAQAKTIYKTVYAKAQTYVQNTPAFSNPVCVVDAAGVHILNSKITAMHAAAAASVLGLPVPGAGTDQGQPIVDGGSVPPVSGQPGAATNLPGEAAKPDRPDSVPGQGMSRPPKPKPVN